MVSPAGTPVTLIDRPGRPEASAFGCGEDDILAVLDDEAATPAEDRCAASPPPPAAINGSFSPTDPLSAFDGESGSGAWKLTVTDTAAGDTGTLNDWSLEFTCAGDMPQGYSAAWFNPDQSGHGFVLEVVEIPGRPDPELLAYWFTFIDGKQAWLIGQGPLEGDRAVLATHIFSGADFPPNFDPAEAIGADWGTLTFDFPDCNNARVTWDSSVPGFGAGSLQIVRLTTLTGLSCGLVLAGENK